jgi:acetolactate synthase I/II/III large subunit
MHVYEAMVKGLESAGVDTAFGGNGENIASLAIALEHSRKIRPIMTRHERSHAEAALLYFAERFIWETLEEQLRHH